MLIAITRPAGPPSNTAEQVFRFRICTLFSHLVLRKPVAAMSPKPESRMGFWSRHLLPQQPVTAQEGPFSGQQAHSFVEMAAKGMTDARLDSLPAFPQARQLG